MTLLLFVMIVINKPSLNKNVSQQHKRQTSTHTILDNQFKTELQLSNI